MRARSMRERISRARLGGALAGACRCSRSTSVRSGRAEGRRSRARSTSEREERAFLAYLTLREGSRRGATVVDRAAQAVPQKAQDELHPIA